MRRLSWIFGLGLTVIWVFGISGCLVRTYTVEKPRVDTKVSGNQGYLMGKPSGQPEEGRLGDTRKITVLEVDVGPKASEKETALSKVKKSRIKDEISEDIILEEPESVTGRYKERKVYKQASKEKAAPECKMYKVQKDDTLQKISEKFYDTTRRWEKIYEANKDVLKSADDIYPGQTLKIPLN